MSTAQLSVQLRRLWLETYAPGQQSFVLSLRLPHRNAFRSPWDGDAGTLGCNGGTCGATWTCLPSRRECELGPGDVSQIAVGGVGMCVADACCTGRALLHVVLALHGCLWGGRVVPEKGGPLLDPLLVPLFGPRLYKVVSGGEREGPKSGPLYGPPVRNFGAKVGVQEADAAGCICCRSYSECEASFRGMLGMVGPRRAMPCVPCQPARGVSCYAVHAQPAGVRVTSCCAVRGLSSSAAHVLLCFARSCKDMYALP